MSENFLLEIVKIWLKIGGNGDENYDDHDNYDDDDEESNGMGC